MARIVRASKPRVIGLPMNANVREDVIEVADPEKPGEWITRKQGRRANNVFESLYVSGRINSEARSAANHMAEIFAKSRGAFNVSEPRDRVQYENSDEMSRMRIRAAYGREFEEVLGRMAQDRAALLKALVRDFVIQDGARFIVRERKNDAEEGVHWRNLVREICHQRAMRCHKTYEADPVVETLADLVAAVIDYRKMRERNRTDTPNGNIRTWFPDNDSAQSTA